MVLSMEHYEECLNGFGGGDRGDSDSDGGHSTIFKGVWVHVPLQCLRVTFSLRTRPFFYHSETVSGS